jgi:hypothetical protein
MRNLPVSRVKKRWIRTTATNGWDNHNRLGKPLDAENSRQINDLA